MTQRSRWRHHIYQEEGDRTRIHADRRKSQEKRKTYINTFTRDPETWRRQGVLRQDLELDGISKESQKKRGPGEWKAESCQGAGPK